MSSDLLKQLKALKTEKGAIASQFKHLVQGSAEYLAQREAMMAISARLKSLEERLKAERSAPPAQASPTPSFSFASLDSMPNYVGEAVFSLKPYGEVPQWSEFVQQVGSRLPSHNPAWLEVIEQSFGHRSYVFVAQDPQGNVLGGLPFVVLSTKLFGTFGVSVPFLNYGGPVCAYSNLHQQLMAGLKDVREKLQLQHLEIRSIYPELGYPASTKKVGMILPLPETDNELEQQLGSKVRAQVKKAELYSPHIQFGRLELLEDFYRVFSHNMRDLGTPVYSKAWFANILQHSQLNAHIAVVYVNRKPVATGFLVRSGALMEIPWASTLKSVNKLNINMWMYRKILEFAIADSCEYFDFGRSTMDAGTFKFKKQWGAQPQQHYWYSVIPKGAEIPALNPDNPKLKLLVALWKWLPLWVANRLGPLIIRGIA